MLEAPAADARRRGIRGTRRLPDPPMDRLGQECGSGSIRPEELRAAIDRERPVEFGRFDVALVRPGPWA
jgi:hypothetical protein